MTKKGPNPNRNAGQWYIADIPGLSKRDEFFLQLGHVSIQAIRPDLDDLRFTLAAPDEQTRLLGEVALQLMIERLAPSAAAVRLSEHVRVTLGGKSRILSAQAMTAAPRKPNKLH